MLFATLKSFINTNLHSVKHHVFFNTFVNCPFQFQSTTLYTVYYRDLQSFTICTSPQTMTIFGATKTNATPQNRVPWHKECSASASICGCGSKASASSAMAPPRRRGRVRSSWEDAAERRWRRLGRQGESWGVLCRKATEISLLIGLYWAWHPPKNGENTFKLMKTNEHSGEFEHVLHLFRVLTNDHSLFLILPSFWASPRDGSTKTQGLSSGKT